MKNLFAWLLVGLLGTSVVVFADGTNNRSRGDLLKDRQYRTNADLNLFVDPTGNDTNACTSTGTAACLTLQGAINKAPKLLRHRITITVAAGNYAGVHISGFTIDPSIQTATAGILFDAALVNVTPATGTATGTATAGTAGSGTTYGTLTDGAQTWTINNLRGRMVTITAGTGVGTIRTVCSNTATVITICGTWTAPNGTSVYAVQTNGAIITSATSQVPNALGTVNVAGGAVQLLDNNTNAASSEITFRNIGISIGASSAVIANGGGTQLQILQSEIAAGVSLLTNGTFVTFTVVSYASASSAISVSTRAEAIVINSLVSGASGGVIVGSAARALTSNVQFIGLTNASLAYINSGSVGQVSATSVRCDCASAATSSCLNVGTSTPGLVGQPGSLQVITGLDVTDCSYGVSAQSGSLIFAAATTFTGNALTYGILAGNGGKVSMPSTPAITAGTSELAIDNGAAVGTFASLPAIYACLASLATGSSICRL